MFKLVESAHARWRAVNGAHLVLLVRAGARFERGQLVERGVVVAARSASSDQHVMRCQATPTTRSLARRAAMRAAGAVAVEPAV